MLYWRQQLGENLEPVWKGNRKGDRKFATVPFPPPKKHSVSSRRFSASGALHSSIRLERPASRDKFGSLFLFFPSSDQLLLFFFNGEMILLGWGGGEEAGREEVSGSEELFCNRPPVLFNTRAAASRLQQPGTISSSLPCDWQQTVCHSVVAWQQQKTKPRHNVGLVCRVSCRRSVCIMYLLAELAERAARPPPSELRKLGERAWRAGRACVYTATVTGRGGYIVDN